MLLKSKYFQYDDTKRAKSNQMSIGAQYSETVVRVRA